MTNRAPSTGPADALRRNALVAGLVLLTVVIETILWLADAGLTGSPRWRMTALGYGAFWAGLLDGWQPNYPGQPFGMFLTHSLLHAGPGHMLGNMSALVWLGPQLVERVGQAGFALVWGLSMIGGGLVFGALSASFSPMVGASGALFGVIGALVILRYRETGQMAPVLWITLGLVVFNVGMYVVQSGVLAWQTHLGGYLAGLAVGAVVDSRKIRDCI